MPGTYYIPCHDEVLIYRPQQMLAFLGNEALAEYIKARLADKTVPEDQEVEGFLDSVGFWSEGIAPAATEPLDPSSHRPTTAALLMTNACNLRCVYCYAAAGQSPPQAMPIEIANQAIDTVWQNAHQIGESSFSLTFHGGGEPTTHWSTLRQAVLHAKSKDLPSHLSLTSNAVWSDRQRQFIVEHFDEIGISCDGIAAVQNRQRPKANGAESFEQVMKSIRALEAAAIPFGIRMTVLPESVDYLEESVAFFIENTTVTSIQVEPTYTDKPGHYADISADFAKRFTESFLRAYDLGNTKGVSVYYSGARPWVLATEFCRAWRTALVVTPSGTLVTCFEIATSDHDRIREFSIGRLDDNGAYWDADKLERFQADLENHREECRNCFCYWHCCGDCATRREPNGARREFRCQVNRDITLGLILRYASEEGLWQGLRAAEPAQTHCDP